MHFDVLHADKIHYHSSDQSEALLGGCALVFVPISAARFEHSA